MSTGEFQQIAAKIRPYTDHIYLHVAGEPLLHPQLEDILKTAGESGLKVNITTNGSLLHARKELLKKYPPRQINISLHDAEENIPSERLNQYLRQTFDFATEVSKDTYISMRLWNRNETKSTDFNDQVIREIFSFFETDIQLPESNAGKQDNLKLAPHIFLQLSSRFTWPDGKTMLTGKARSCYALRDQVAILANGTVVPCCIDAGGILSLGNIFRQDMEDILEQEKAIRLRQGLQNGIFTETFCRSCGFIITNG